VDLASVIGNVLVWVLIVSAMAMGVGVGAYIDIPSVLIVVGGSIGALFIGFKMEQMKNIMKVFMISIKPTIINDQELIKKLVDYAMQARRDGILSLEAAANNEENDFLKKGLMMAVDGNEPSTVRELLEIEMEATDNRHKDYINVFGGWGDYAGAYGLIGTLVGLVAMLVNMSDPSAIGPAMAVALLTTMYGAMIANMITGPVSTILSVRAADEMVSMTIMLNGITSIQAGDNPRTLEAKLLSYMSPNERVSQFE
jgi:chemotaxis protein MotA